MPITLVVDPHTQARDPPGLTGYSVPSPAPSSSVPQARARGRPAGPWAGDGKKNAANVNPSRACRTPVLAANATSLSPDPAQAGGRPLWRGGQGRGSGAASSLHFGSPAEGTACRPKPQGRVRAQVLMLGAKGPGKQSFLVLSPVLLRKDSPARPTRGPASPDSGARTETYRREAAWRGPRRRQRSRLASPPAQDLQGEEEAGPMRAAAS